MKFLSLFLSIVLLSILFIGGCVSENQTQTNENMKNTISEIENLSELKFPQESEIIFDVNEDSGREDYYEWVIFSPNQIDLTKETWKGGSEATLALIKDVLPDRDMGLPKGETSTNSSWENKQGKWQAKRVETDKGSYLLLEVFK